LHFTLTSCSWLNMEILFGIITRQAIRRGTFRSVKELTAAIGTFIDAYNDRCRPFTWTKDADQLIGISGRQELTPGDTSGPGAAGRKTSRLTQAVASTVYGLPPIRSTSDSSVSPYAAQNFSTALPSIWSGRVPRAAAAASSIPARRSISTIS